MKIATYPGTFDPVTNGHIDIILRGTEIFDKIVVTVARNISKTTLFSTEERLELLKSSLGETPKVEVVAFSGLVVDHARSIGAVAIIRGLRALSDFEYEFQMALMNRKLAPEINTVFLMPNEKYTYLNSSIIRHLSEFESDVSEFVPIVVQEALKLKFKK
ncbi:MAG: pantetheine-phosphate adenylyltransferase [Ignavibacteriaceae bacterium]